MSNFILRQWYNDDDMKDTKPMLFNVAHIRTVFPHVRGGCCIEMDDESHGVYHVLGTLEEITVHMHQGGR